MATSKDKETTPGNRKACGPYVFVAKFFPCCFLSCLLSCLPNLLGNHFDLGIILANKMSLHPLHETANELGLAGPRHDQLLPGLLGKLQIGTH